jgi:predicted dehydrogenase
LKIGIVGTGNMGKIHARILNDFNSLVGVADSAYDIAKKTAEIYKVPAFDNFQALVEETSPDALIIATPTSSHAKIAEEIASNYDCIRGLLIEKPLASTLEDGKKVADIVNKKGIVTLVSHSEIYNPIVERAISLIDTGAIGKPQSIIHDRRGLVSPSRIPSLGDVFEDLGVHDFDIMARISQGKAKLYAQGAIEKGLFNSGTVIINFESGSEHVFHLSRQYAGRRRYMDVAGSEGTLMLDLFGQIIKVQHLDQAPMAASDTIKLPERGATIKVYGEPVREVLNDFISCIKSGATPRVGIDDALCALKVVEATRESASTGKVIDIVVGTKK